MFVNQIWQFLDLHQYLLRRFDLDFWQAWQQISSKLHYREILWEKFQGMPHFAREMGSYSSIKFGIFEPYTNTLLS